MEVSLGQTLGQVAEAANISDGEGGGGGGGGVCRGGYVDVDDDQLA